MNPVPYIHIFATVAILALCLHIFSTFWLPLTVGLGAAVVFGILLRRKF